MESLLIACVGACVGSYFGCSADRWGLTFTPHHRSCCDYCDRPLPVFALIPVLSWIVLWGKSHCCRHALPLRHPLQELFLGCVVGLNHLLCYHPPFHRYICLQVATLAGGWIGLVDWQYQRIPLAGLILLCLTSLMLWSFSDLEIPFSSLLFVFVFLSAVNAVTFLWKNHILPKADWILFVCLGGWLPFQELPWFLVAVGGGGLLTAWVYKLKEGYTQTFPFAPAIILSWWLIMLSCSL